MVAPVRYEASLREEPIDADPDTRNPRVSPGYLGPVRLGRRRGAGGVRPQRQSGGLRGAPEERHRRARQDRPRPLLEPVQLPRVQGADRRAARRGGHSHLLRPRGGRLQAGAGVPGRPVGPGEPHPARRDHLRLHRARRSAHARLGVPSRGAPGEAGGGALAAEDRRRCRCRGTTRSRCSSTWTAPWRRRTGRAACRSSTASAATASASTSRSTWTTASPRTTWSRRGCAARSCPTTGCSSAITATPGSSGASIRRAAPPPCWS